MELTTEAPNSETPSSAASASSLACRYTRMRRSRRQRTQSTVRWCVVTERDQAREA